MKVAILGAGNGGCAVAVDLVLRGFDATLCSARYPEHLRSIAEKGGLEYSGVLGEGFATVRTSNSVSEAVSAAHMVVVTTSATAHEYYAQQMAGALESDCIVMLNPGSTGGALNVARVLAAQGVTHLRGICETNTLTYTCRLLGPSHVRIYNMPPQTLFANLPAKNQDEAARTVKEVFRSVVPAKNVLETGLANINAIMHPAGMILNASLIERTGGDYYYYYEGTTPAVGTLIEAVDAERICVAKAFSISPRTFVEYFHMNGYTARPDVRVHDAIVSSIPDRYIKAPKSLNHRYLMEDVGYGLVPMAYLARVAGIETPVIDSLIHLSGRLVNVNHWEEGLTLSKMGLEGVSVEGINRVLLEGFPRRTVD